MKKVSLVVLNRYKQSSLQSLRKLGLVHLETLEGSSEALTETRSLYDRLNSAKMLIQDLKLPKNFEPQNAQSDIGKNLEKEALLSKFSVNKTKDLEKALFYAEEIHALQEAKKELTDEVQAARKEIDRLASWGGVNPDDFAYLSEKGISLSMYEIPTAALKKIPEETKILLVNSDKNATRFLLLSFASEENENILPPEAFQIAFADESTQSLEKAVAEKNLMLDAIQNDLYKSLSYLPVLNAELQKLSKDIEFENIYAAMPEESGSENGNKKSFSLKAENKALTWVRGFIPTEDVEALKNFAQKEKIALMITEPTEEDDVPTKLKNNKVVSLIYPVTDFLGTVPGYREQDISGWFLLFFSIFFGMIFGDGGYGLLILLTGLGLIVVSKVKGKKVEPMIVLVEIGRASCRERV